MERSARAGKLTGMEKQAKRSLYLETFGCQMNVLDSELVRGALEREGYGLTADLRSADVVLFNTCSVRQHAEDKVYGRLIDLRRMKLDRPEMVIGVIGCMAERDGPGLLSRMPHVDLLCGPGHLGHLPGLIEEVLAGRAREAGFGERAAVALAGVEKRSVAKALRDPNAGGLEELDSSRQYFTGENAFQAYVRIQRGCDKFCTYCVVPFTRGPERSRSPASIVDECRMLADRGVREVTLLGQTVNSYQHEEGGGRVDFADLLARVHEVSGIERIRFTTSFPKDFPNAVFEAIRDLPKLCEYVHMPAQSGSDAVLMRMKRTYSVGEYRDVIERARSIIPGVELASDFIVGFCGETEEDFAQTLELARWGRFKNSFIFKYSPRPGTSAERNLADDVPESVKRERNHRLLEVQEHSSRAIHESKVGHTVEVLVEGPSRKANDPRHRHEDGTIQLTGRTRGDLICVFDGKAELAGRLAKIRVSGASPYTLFGEICEVEGESVRPHRAEAQGPRGAVRLPLPLLG